MHLASLKKRSRSEIKLLRSTVGIRRFQIRNEVRTWPRSEEIGSLEALGSDFQGKIDVVDVGPAEIGTRMSRGSRKSTLAWFDTQFGPDHGLRNELRQRQHP